MTVPTMLCLENWGAIYNFGLEKLLSILSLMGRSVKAWKMRMLRAMQIMGAWFVEFQWEARSLSERAIYVLFSIRSQLE